MVFLVVGGWLLVQAALAAWLFETGLLDELCDWLNDLIGIRGE